MTRWALAAVTLVLACAGVARGQPAAPAGHVYALVDVPHETNKIYGFRLDATFQSLSPLPGFPIATGGIGTGDLASERLAYGGSRVYAINDWSDTLSVFVVDRGTGALTKLPFAPVVLGDGQWVCVAVHPSGSPVVVGDAAGSLASFVVTEVSATAAPGSPFSTGAARPYSCAFDRTGSHVYTGGSSGPFIAGFSVSTASGVLTTLQGSPFDSGGSTPAGYATDSSGRLFSVSMDESDVRAFTTLAGAPTAVDGNAFPSRLGGGVHGVAHPAGFFMVADRNDSRVAVYRIGGSGSATTLVSAVHSPIVSGGTSTNALALTDDARFLIALHGTSRNLTVFRIGQAMGTLFPLPTQPVNALGLTGFAAGLVFVPRLPSEPGSYDRDGDARADLGLYRPSSGVWWILRSATFYNTFFSHAFGLSGDIPVPADYDGDRKMDVAVFRPSEGIWYLLLSAADYTTLVAQAWGEIGDIPVPGDYDGDGRADIAVYRPSSGVWWILQSSTNNATHLSIAWGSPTDVVAPADYDGDRRTDVAVYRPSTGTWWLLESRSEFSTSMALTFGVATDVPVPGDYDGDGKADVAIFRASAGQWHWLRSGMGHTTARGVPLGLDGDIAVPADYDGDGKPEAAIFRPSTGLWRRLLSTSDYTSFIQHQWGLSGDVPLPRR